MAVSRRTPSLAHSWHSEGAEMASIRRRNGRYHVQIRKNGYPAVTKTFIHLKTAKKWASGVETDMERLITLALETGMRRGEILNVKKSHIDLTIKTLFIPYTKTNEPRTVPNLFKCRFSVSYRPNEGVSEAFWKDF